MVLTAFLIASGSCVAQTTFVWLPSSGGNGHTYEFVSAPSISWAAARDAAVARGGYLATITSPAENDVIVANRSDPYFWIGGYQPTGSPEPAGGWRWVTSEPFTYSNWSANEPNNLGANENFLELDGIVGRWNDNSSGRTSSFGYVVEYTGTPPRFRSLPTHQHDPADGRSALKSFQLTPEGSCTFIFSTAEPGAMCLASWSSNLRQWFPLIQFNSDTPGTEVIDTPTQPQKFYRTTYLPPGVSIATDFAYPIGSGSVLEQIAPERNTLFPASPVARPDRGATTPGAGWYNIQDVGSYYSLFGGLHAGEDWNSGSDTDDVGEPVKAVANGHLIDIRPASASGPAASGYVVLVRHWLQNGDSIDSLYVHVAPDTIAGNPNSPGTIGSEAAFTYQEGSPVAKGNVIGVIGAVSSFPPHLHLEMRNTVTNPNSLWPNDTGNGYYGPVSGLNVAEVQAAFVLMQKDGIIDPSDFIDDHQ